VFFIFKSNNQQVAPTNRRRQRQQSNWWRQTRQFINFEINNQRVAPTNQPAARKAARASVFLFLKATINRWHQPTGVDKGSKATGGVYF